MAEPFITAKPSDTSKPFCISPPGGFYEKVRLHVIVSYNSIFNCIKNFISKCIYKQFGIANKFL